MRPRQHRNYRRHARSCGLCRASTTGGSGLCRDCVRTPGGILYLRRKRALEEARDFLQAATNGPSEPHPASRCSSCSVLVRVAQRDGLCMSCRRALPLRYFA